MIPSPGFTESKLVFSRLQTSKAKLSIRANNTTLDPSLCFFLLFTFRILQQQVFRLIVNFYQNIRDDFAVEIFHYSRELTILSRRSNDYHFIRSSTRRFIRSGTETSGTT